MFKHLIVFVFIGFASTNLINLANGVTGAVGGAKDAIKGGVEGVIGESNGLGGATNIAQGAVGDVQNALGGALQGSSGQLVNSTSSNQSVTGLITGLHNKLAHLVENTQRQLFGLIGGQKGEEFSDQLQTELNAVMTPIRLIPGLIWKAIADFEQQLESGLNKEGLEKLIDELTAQAQSLGSKVDGLGNGVGLGNPQTDEAQSSSSADGSGGSVSGANIGETRAL